MFTMDHFTGSFEFETETGKDEKGVYARALGKEARHPFSTDQAVNDLNAIIDVAISKGELIPSMGG